MLKFRSRWSLNCRRSLQNAIYNYLNVKGFFLTSVLAWFQLLEQAGLIWLNLISWDSYNQVTEYRTDTEIRKFNKYCFEKSKIRVCVWVFCLKSNFDGAVSIYQFLFDLIDFFLFYICWICFFVNGFNKRFYKNLTHFVRPN